MLYFVRGSQPLPTINITREQYDNALAKWNSLQVRDYEVKVHYEGPYGGEEIRKRTWKLVVHVDHTTENIAETVTHFERLDGSVTDEMDDFLREELTIGKQFESVDYFLQEQSNHRDSRFSNVDIQFHPIIGYPEHIRFSAPHIGTILVNVEDVKILN
jgi:hypothetical protein